MDLSVGVDQDLRRCPLALERGPRLVELAGQTRRPQAHCERNDGRRGGGNGEHGNDSASARLERNHVLRRLRADVRENAVAQSRTGCRAGRRHGKRLRRLPERLELLLAVRARRQVRLIGAPLVGVERVERVARGQLVNSGLHDPSCVSSRSSRRRASPANILLLIVPSGTPSLSASSDWEKPP